MKRALVITSVASMVDQFLVPTLEMLQNMEYEVHAACNFERGNTCSDERVSELKSKLRDRNILFHQIDFARDVSKVSDIIRAYKEVRRLVTAHEYDFIHCHSPIGGLITRLACRKIRKHGTRVFYTAHGFHFFKGAPIRNWILYYPVEKLCSRFTDVLITINREDYALAKNKFYAKQVEYVPGVGIDVGKFADTAVDRDAKRAELGVPGDAFLLVSVGELNRNKNHAAVIRALAMLNNPNVYYCIAGTGPLREELDALADEAGVGGQVRLLGFRNDIAELYKCADLCVFPSFREGLPVSVMEAMACGLPVAGSRIRGMTDLLDEKGGILFDPRNAEDCREAIRCLLDDAGDPSRALRRSMGNHNAARAKEYDVQRINQIMKLLYEKNTAIRPLP